MTFKLRANPVTYTFIRRTPTVGPCLSSLISLFDQQDGLLAPVPKMWVLAEEVDCTSTSARKKRTRKTIKRKLGEKREEGAPVYCQAFAFVYLPVLREGR